MDEGYIYDSDYYCDHCLPVTEGHPEVYPSGGESDTPVHCSKCRCPLKHSLTSDGIEYVLDELSDTLHEGPDGWNKVWCFPSVPEEFRTSTVVAMAKNIADNNSHDLLPILADALEDANYNGELLPALRNGVPGGVFDLGRLRDAILGDGDYTGDYYILARQVDVTRDWAKDLLSHYHHGEDEFLERFLDITAPDADVPNVLAEFVEQESMGFFADRVDWSEIDQTWINRLTPTEGA